MVDDDVGNGRCYDVQLEITREKRKVNVAEKIIR